MRTKLMAHGKTGSAPCRRRVKAGGFFCGLPNHQKFAFLCGLPTEVDDSQEVEYKDARLPHLRTGFIIHGNLVELEKSLDLSALPNSDIPLRRAEEKKKRKLDASVEEDEGGSVFPHFSCIYDNPYSDEQCQEAGEYEDPECPGAKFCSKHTFPEDNQVLEAKMNNDPERAEDLIAIINLDRLEEITPNVATQRFILASKLGLGTPPPILAMLQEIQ